jgi:hypothetical protein
MAAMLRARGIIAKAGTDEEELNLKSHVSQEVIELDSEEEPDKVSR